MISASAGQSPRAWVSTASIRSSRIMIAAFSTGPAPVPSISLPPLSTLIIAPSLSPPPLAARH